MKTLSFLCASVGLAVVLGSSGCDKQPSLKSVADKVPVKLVCNTHSDAELEAILKRYKNDPQVVIQEVIDGIENPDPKTALAFSCLLVDGKAFLERNGRRLLEAELYDRIKQALDDLGL